MTKVNPLMPKLNQIIALEKGIKARSNRAVTGVYHLLQKADLFNGLSRTYRPRDEEGEQLPPETQIVQQHAERLLAEMGSAESELLDIVLTKDTANQEAMAPLVVDGIVLAEKLPVTYLLFLEKRLTDLKTIVTAAPVLDPTKTWHHDAATDSYRAEPVETHRSKKVPKNHVKFAATDKHPAQVEMYTEDIVVGYWTKTDVSGALPAQRKNEILDRLERLGDAVKIAREHANSLEVQPRKIGGTLFDYLLER